MTIEKISDTIIAMAKIIDDQSKIVQGLIGIVQELHQRVSALEGNPEEKLCVECNELPAKYKSDSTCVKCHEPKERPGARGSKEKKAKK
jgi:hypothetical protein